MNSLLRADRARQRRATMGTPVTRPPSMLAPSSTRWTTGVRCTCRRRRTTIGEPNDFLIFFRRILMSPSKNIVDTTSILLSYTKIWLYNLRNYHTLSSSQTTLTTQHNNERPFVAIKRAHAQNINGVSPPKGNQISTKFQIHFACTHSI